MLSVSDEAERARCETCEGDYSRDNGIECEGCGGWICAKCWKGYRGLDPHWCGELTFRSGKRVQIGDITFYPDRPAIRYAVSEMPGTFKRGQMCFGTEVKGREHKRVAIRPRLMEALDGA